MASAFDDLDPPVAEFIRERLLAGDAMEIVRIDAHGIARVRGITLPELTGYKMRKLRNELFGSLQKDPAAVKELANGPVLNSNEIVRYTRSRKVVRREYAKQLGLAV